MPLGDARKIAMGASVGYAGFPGMYGLVWVVGTMAGRRVDGVLLHPPLWPYDYAASIAGGLVRPARLLSIWSRVRSWVC